LFTVFALKRRWSSLDAGSLLLVCVTLHSTMTLLLPLQDVPAARGIYECVISVYYALESESWIHYVPFEVSALLERLSSSTSST